MHCFRELAPQIKTKTMQRANYLSLFFLLFTTATFAQSASLSGKVIDAESKDPILFGTITLYQNGVMKAGTETDFDGNYNFSNLDPGTYAVEASYLGYQTLRVTGAVIAAGSVLKLDVSINKNQTKTLEVIVTDYNKTLGEPDNGTIEKTLTNEAEQRINQESYQNVICSPILNRFRRDKALLSGKMMIKENKEPLLFGPVELYQNGVLIYDTETDFAGNYSFISVNPGIYDLKASYRGFQSVLIKNVRIIPDKTIALDIELSEEVKSVDSTPEKNH